MQKETDPSKGISKVTSDGKKTRTLNWSRLFPAFRSSNNEETNRPALDCTMHKGMNPRKGISKVTGDGKKTGTLDCSRLFPKFRPSNHKEQNARPALDILEQEEFEIAQELRSCCTPYGKEKKLWLAKSASALLKLAEVYLRQAEQKKGNPQKLSYIRCCALLNSALVRLTVLRDSDKVNNAELFYQRLSHSLLKACHSRFQTTDLLHASKTVFERVTQTRQEISQFLRANLVRRIGNTKNSAGSKSMDILKTLAKSEDKSTLAFETILSQGDDEIVEHKIIQSVMDLNRTTSSHYKAIMCDIADKCINLLGNSPCKFSIVGLGSLSRQEITLYSDFEHVILLEEDTESWANYQNVVEYFRWFSVLFQVIIIGFGETILPSVQVPSLNDAYSGKVDDDWFYDAYTPRGISFDGMLPHSCKIPLGRQQATPKRPHLVELIQTPRNMAKYLSKEEHLKNGYNLEDVLRQTCLVYGDEDCYISFVKERNVSVQKQLPLLQEQYRKEILENCNCYVQNGSFAMLGLTDFDTKTVLYRPLITGLWFIARIYSIDFDTTFNAIKSLHDIGAINQILHHKLSYAVAAACEVRVKIYDRASQQKCKVQLKDVYKIIGEDTLCVCKDMIRYLRYSIPGHISAASLEDGAEILLMKSNRFLVTRSVNSLFLDIFHRGLYKEGAALGEKLWPPDDTDDDSTVRHEYVMFLTYYNAGWYTPNRQEHYHGKAKELFFRLISKQKIQLDLRAKMDVACSFALICKQQKRFSDSMWALGLFWAMHAELQKRGEYDPEFVEAYRDYHNLAGIVLDNHSAKRHLRETLWKENFNKDCELIQRLFLLTDERTFMSNHGIALREELASIATDVQRNLAKMARPYMLLIKVLEHQLKLWWLKDAIETLNFLLEGPKPSSKYIVSQVEQTNLQALKVLCLCRLGQQDKVMKDFPNLALKHNNLVHDIVLEILVSTLWKKLHRSRNTEQKLWEEKPIIIIYWLIDLCFVKKRRDIFLTHKVVQEPLVLHGYASFAVDFFSRGLCRLAVSAAAGSIEFAHLLLCKETANLAQHPLINNLLSGNFVKSKQTTIPTLRDRPTLDYRRFESNNRGANIPPSIFPPPWIHIDSEF